MLFNIKIFDSLPGRYFLVSCGIAAQTGLLFQAGKGVSPSNYLHPFVLVGVFVFLLAQAMVLWGMLNFKQQKPYFLLERLKDIGPTLLATFICAYLLIFQNENVLWHFEMAAWLTGIFAGGSLLKMIYRNSPQD